MQLSLAFSPCPNDTFMFHAIAAGEISLPGHEISVHLHDVETLNRAAGRGRFDVTKLSFHAWLLHRERYCLLRVGAALGFGCGPLVVARAPLAPADLERARVALPGEFTTAHLLFRLWQPRCRRKTFVSYDRILTMVERGEVDAGVIIHESRFTYAQRGFACVQDLGEWWTRTTGAPIPLGCMALRRELAPGLQPALEELLRRSIERARAHPDAALPYMRAHAQELAAEVMRRHVETYVNAYSLDLGEEGRVAVEKLEEMLFLARQQHGRGGDRDSES